MTRTKCLAAILALMLPLGAQAAAVKAAVAANMQYAFGEIAAAFTHDTGVAVQTAYDSSGKFTTQILSGAPFELFLSADSHFARKLSSAGFTLGEPRTYAVGTLVLWSLDNSFDGAHWQQWLQSAHGKVAIADPQTAPYGTEAVHALAYYHLTDVVAARLVTGESIGQAAQYVSSQAAQAGFVAKAQVIALPAAARGHWVELPQQSYAPIVQDMVLLKPAAGNPDARRLFDYLQGPKARGILQRYGYRLP